MKINRIAPVVGYLVWIGVLSSLAPAASGGDFGSYWYQGKAEITSYQLEQARYGEIHEGHAVMIYVTEDFSREKHVKLDRPDAAGDDRVKILKLNATRKFLTGLYPYSMMTSVFSPVNGSDPRALKVTTSSQEWCGHTFTQLNRTPEGYRVLGLSYFESEGDETIQLDDAMTEDQIWTTVRLDPSKLPLGKLRLIPGTVVQRLKHWPWGVAMAEAKLEPAGDGLMAYTLTYPELDRTLTIRYQQAFPHEIESWEEAYRSGAQRLTTRATRMKRIMSEYWSKNQVVDAALRKDLDLP